MQHMTDRGNKDERRLAAGQKPWQANFATVKDVLDLGADSQGLEPQLERYYQDLPEGAPQVAASGQALQTLYERLYDKPVLGYAFVDNTSQTYLARLDRGDDAGFAIAGGYSPGAEYPQFGDEPTRYA
jgi:hypothetical protein